MKEKLTNNLAIKLIALFCAFFVWLAVVNVANPIKVSTREVPVTITNDQVLEQADLAYDVVGKKTAVISFKIRTKDDYKVKASDFNAYADLSEMYDVTGAIPIRVEVVNNEELLESTPVVKSPEVIKITTEALQTKAFTLKAYPQGEAADGYEAGEVTMVPSQVTVKGPTSLIGQISSVGIRFNIDGAVADVSGTATPEYFDANGNVLSDLGDSVKTVGGDVSYTMQILKVKEVPLDFDVSGEVADGYRYTGPKTDIKSVSVAGLKTDLASVSTITIQGPSLNVQGATKDVECEIDRGTGQHDDQRDTAGGEADGENLYGQTGECDSKRKEQQLQLYCRRYEDGSQGTGTRGGFKQSVGVEDEYPGRCIRHGTGRAHGNGAAPAGGRV